jgi:hypothetical protein
MGSEIEENDHGKRFEHQEEWVRLVLGASGMAQAHGDAFGGVRL